jgi:transcriptional regulator with XRE-family HTH domain
MNDFHSRLKDSIERSKLTLKEVSKKSGVSKKTIENWTRNADPTKPRLEQGVWVAQALGVSAEYLVTGNAPGGLSEKSFQIALMAENLSDEGKKVALNLVGGLITDFPYAISDSLRPAT